MCIFFFYDWLIMLLIRIQQSYYELIAQSVLHATPLFASTLSHPHRPRVYVYLMSHPLQRAGRFVRTANSECGIHTRVAAAGAPHGGKLIDRMVHDKAAREALIAGATRVVELNERQSCDVELLLNGGFSPLTGEC